MSRPIAVLLIGLCLPCTKSAVVRADGRGLVRQWRVTEVSLTADREYTDPFDWQVNRLSAEFRGPGGRVLEVLGFWDGGKSWKIRFAPTVPGDWTYETSFSQRDDFGLHGQRGTIRADKPLGENPVYRHGGFLQISPNGRHLTYTDGTPFFWLGDTWWRCPSSGVPFANFKRMVDVRSRQGYTVFQAHGHRPIFPTKPTEVARSWAPESGVGAFAAVRETGSETLRYWRETDKYHAYANDRGIIGVIGFAGHSLLDSVSLSDLRRLWHYYLARYGAYAVTFLITQEYNAMIGDMESRVPKLLELGRFIHRVDPYGRAISVHPWVIPRDHRQAWSESWHDFIMLQGGHRQYVNPRVYHEIYFAEPVKPILESEANYEAFRNDRFHVDADCIRRTAYTAIQCGSFGFTYGAQGLYAGVLSKELPGPTSRWGPVLTWAEALELPGGAQMQHLRNCYESVAWWKMEPRPELLRTEPKLSERQQTLVKSDGDTVFLIYFLQGTDPRKAIWLKAAKKDMAYTATWFDPRTGEKKVLSEPLVPESGELKLPDRKDNQDWMLIVRKDGMT